MGALPWCQFVADFCYHRGAVYNDVIGRLRRSEGYYLARAAFECGAAKADVIRLLEGALKEAFGCPSCPHSRPRPSSPPRASGPR